MSDDHDHLDWTDPEAVRRFLVELRVRLDDMDGVVKDSWRKPRKQELGHKKRVEIYDDSRDATLALIDYAMPPERTPPIQ
jgi:hypothetical protein